MNQSRLLFQRIPRSSRFFTTSVPKKSFGHGLIQGAAMLSLGSTLVLGCGGLILYETSDSCRHVAHALHRCSIAGIVGIKVAYDYQRTLTNKSYTNEEAYEEAKRACHRRCAESVLVAIQRLGGVYVKLGQHISVMQYLLPNEWCDTMRVLQDRCEATSEEDVRALFVSDYGVPVDELFESFEWTPLGVASLAQVHKARLTREAVRQLKEQEDGQIWLDEDDRWVAVKLQHPYLDEYCQLDMDTVSFIFDIVKRVFPDFGFDWFAEEMRESIPKELDFVHETQNSVRVRNNFAEDSLHHRTSLVIPRVIWAKRRIMCMEFIRGARIDDLEYMKKHNIDPNQVSAELTRVFSEMIFLHGFVHCDPHPGNVFIRPAKNPKHAKHNFDLVLLDHGLYRELSEELRSNYAHLWTALIQGDEQGIEKYAYKVGGTDIYQIFACMLTGREWDKISQSDLGSARKTEEVGRISEGAMTYLVEVADILGKLPRPVLLLLKTNDLLRHVDEQLSDVSDERLTYVIMGSYCSKAVWLETKKHIAETIRSIGFSFRLLKELFRAWWQYESLAYGLWLYQYSARLAAKLNWTKKKEISHTTTTTTTTTTTRLLLDI